MAAHCTSSNCTITVVSRLITTLLQSIVKNYKNLIEYIRSI